MSLLSICSDLALNVGLQVPTQVIGSSDRQWSEAVAFADEAGEELARRADWGALTESATLTGDGTDKLHDMPAGFDRLVRGVCITGSGGTVRPLTRAEWNTLTPVEGVPRYFLLEGAKVRLWPYLAAGATVSASYQSRFWCSNGTDAWMADDETSLIDETLFARALIVRWRRQKGMPYTDEEAEYEAMLADMAGFDERSRL